MAEKILITTSTFGESDSTPIELLKKEGYEVVLNPYRRKLTKEEAKKLFPGFVGIIAGLETLDEEVLASSGLKVISRCGAGISNVDLKAADRLKIKVCSTPGGPTLAVAELTMAAMLSLLRALPQMSNDLHQGAWKKRLGFQLKRKNVAIIGFGRIGQKVAQLLKPFEAHIMAIDPVVRNTAQGVEFLTIEAALPKADIITIHCSGTEEILGYKEFNLMKNGVFVLNVARGGCVNEEALIKALDAGKVSGAWFDTFVDEPYAGRLKDYPQVLLTPHIGSYTKEGREKMEFDSANNLIHALRELKNGK